MADAGIVGRLLGELKGLLFGYTYIDKEETGQTKSTFNLSELLLGLSKLSINDGNKQLLFDAGVLDILVLSLERALETRTSTLGKGATGASLAGSGGGGGGKEGEEADEEELEDAKAYALRTLINLCFLDALQAKMLSHASLRRVLKSLGESPATTERIRGLLDRLQ
jgi:hypothetical protein